MDFTRREIALIFLVLGIAIVCIAAWMEHRRKYKLMPSLIAPMPLMIFGVAIAMISFIVMLLPNPG